MNRGRNHFQHSRNGEARSPAARRGSPCLYPMALMTIDCRLQMKHFEIVRNNPSKKLLWEILSADILRSLFVAGNGQGRFDFVAEFNP
jgi:hypothetical protein